MRIRLIRSEFYRGLVEAYDARKEQEKLKEEQLEKKETSAEPSKKRRRLN